MLVRADQDKALKGYTNILGLEKRVENPTPDGPRFLTVGVKGNDFQLVLWLGTPGQAQPAMGRPPASVTIETDDIKAVEQFKWRGAFVSDVLEFPWATSRSSGPDGNRLQIREGPAPERRRLGASVRSGAPAIEHSGAPAPRRATGSRQNVIVVPTRLDERLGHRSWMAWTAFQPEQWAGTPLHTGRAERLDRWLDARLEEPAGEVQAAHEAVTRDSPVRRCACRRTLIAPACEQPETTTNPRPSTLTTSA